MNYIKLQEVYSKYFSLAYLGKDISSKFAVISLISFITKELKKKHPRVTYYQVIYKIAGDILPEEYIARIAVICEDFAYGCTEFPTFGIDKKDIPEKIKEILSNWLPF